MNHLHIVVTVGVSGWFVYLKFNHFSYFSHLIRPLSQFQQRKVEGSACRRRAADPQGPSHPCEIFNYQHIEINSNIDNKVSE